MTDLVPCPLCGGSEGYSQHPRRRGFISLVCLVCGKHVCFGEGSTSRRWYAHLMTEKRDAAWNAAGAYADGLRREVKRLCELCTSVHDRLLRGDSDSELLAMLEEAWKGGSDGR